MEASPELRDLTQRFYQTLSTGDLSFMERLISRQPGVINIGSDPNEWWVGSDAFLKIFQVQLREMGGNVRVTDSDPQAFREGSVGWVADRAIFELSDGTKLPFRLTAVYHQEDGAWKLVHSHNSIGVGNEQALGQDLTVE